MNKNRFSRTTPKSRPKNTKNNPPKFYIRRSDITDAAFEARVRYIESILDVLLESRFGVCYVVAIPIDFIDQPEPEPVDFLALYESEALEAAHYHALSLLQQMELGTQKAETRPVGSVPSSDLTPNQGRGSP